MPINLGNNIEWAFPIPPDGEDPGQAAQQAGDAAAAQVIDDVINHIQPAGLYGLGGAAGLDLPYGGFYKAKGKAPKPTSKLPPLELNKAAKQVSEWIPLFSIAEVMAARKAGKKIMYFLEDDEYGAMDFLSPARSYNQPTIAKLVVKGVVAHKTHRVFVHCAAINEQKQVSVWKGKCYEEFHSLMMKGTLGPANNHGMDWCVLENGETVEGLEYV